MELSPSDIRNRSFSQSLRGLEEKEVYAFLDEVADQWDEMTRRAQELEERVQMLEAKLDEIGDTAAKAQTAKERAEALQEEMHAKEQRLKDKENDLDVTRERLEAKQAELRTIAQRLQDTLQEEAHSLSSLAMENGTAANGTADAASSTTTETDDTEDAAPEVQSTEEWVDSLFPNRLPGSLPTEQPEQEEPTAEEAPDEMSASESQFKAIKEDVQESRTSPPRHTSPDEEGEAPPTEEINQIWDVFEEQG